nr:protein trichome birefringence-like 8 [Ipomoea batatas]
MGQSYAPQACDYSYGEWVWDEGYPGEKYTENCPFLDPGFRCHRSGRRDLEYQKWRWKPHGCHLPRVPFLVPVRRPPANASKEVKGVLRLDQLHWFFRKLVGADVLVFSGGHWWNEDKTHKM